MADKGHICLDPFCRIKAKLDFPFSNISALEHRSRVLILIFSGIKPDPGLLCQPVQECFRPFGPSEIHPVASL